MAWNAPGDNDPKDPWKDARSKTSSLENKVNEFFSGLMDGNGQGDGPDADIILNVVAVLSVIWLLSGMYLVDEKERGVVLRFGKYQETVSSGFNWSPRFIDKVKIFNVTQVTPLTVSSTMLTTDENIVDIDLSVQYRIAEPENFWLKIKEPEATLKHAVESSLRHVVGTSNMDRVLTDGKEEVANEIHSRLRKLLTRYKTGIVIDRVNIVRAQPPKDVKDAFEDVNKAAEDKRKIINQAETYRNGLLPEARGEAEARLSAAQAYKERVIAEAEGEASYFKQLQAEYAKAPRVTRKRLYVDAMEKVMNNSTKIILDVKGGNNMMYLPLDKIIGQPSSGIQQKVTKQAVTLPKVSAPTPKSSIGNRSREAR
ncbi:MAG: FtsH protease activity modulator HflK [Pseudomonadota bacterium]